MTVFQSMGYFLLSVQALSQRVTMSWATVTSFQRTLWYHLSTSSMKHAARANFVNPHKSKCSLFPAGKSSSCVCDCPQVIKETTENNTVNSKLLPEFLKKKILGEDVRLTASLADSIAELKKQLEDQESIDVSRQRWFFSGKLLTDKTRLQDAKIQKDFVVQVIVNMNPPLIAN